MTYIKQNHLLHKENKRMNKIEAQKIIDGIDSSTVIDYNWLDYLLEEKSLLTLNALYTVFDMTYPEILGQYEGECISKFQTKKEIYVGKTIKHLDRFYLIVAQDELYFYYTDIHGKLRWESLNNVDNYLV